MRPACSLVISFWTLAFLVFQPFVCSTPPALCATPPSDFQAVREGVIERIKAVETFHAFIEMKSNYVDGRVGLSRTYLVDWDGVNWRVDESSDLSSVSVEGVQERLNGPFQSSLILTAKNRIDFISTNFANGGRVIANSTPLSMLSKGGAWLPNWHLLGMSPTGEAFLYRDRIDELLALPSGEGNLGEVEFFVATKPTDSGPVSLLTINRTDGVSLRAQVSADFRILESEIEGKTSLTRLKCEHWQNCDVGYQWPHKITRERFRNGELQAAVSFTLSDIKINTNIEPARFTAETMPFEEEDRLRVLAVDSTGADLVWRNGGFIEDNQQPIRLVVPPSQVSNSITWAVLVAVNSLIAGLFVIFAWVRRRRVSP